MEELKLSTRDSSTSEKLYAIESLDVSADAYMLLQYLKNEFTQKEILRELGDYVDNSISFEDAEESVQHLHDIILRVEDKVELEEPQESMQRITLWEEEEELGRYLALGLNTDYDQSFQFSPRDLILVGGRRGAGKSITCANIANSVFERGKTAIYFTIEMDSRSILQRICSISTGIPQNRLRTKNLSVTEWERVAGWWASRFQRGQELLHEYREHRNFKEFHSKLTTTCELLPNAQLDVVYDPSLTLGKIRSELDKKVKSSMDVGVIIVDYINQVKRSNGPSRTGQYDWTEQIEVSKALKSMAQEYKVPVFSPYQVDATGEARFAKGILDAADAAFTLNPYSSEDGCVSFNCVKMRSGEMRNFTSTMDWETLKIGPDSAFTPEERERDEHKTGEDINDL
jgi:replicative DNA helicase